MRVTGRDILLETSVLVHLLRGKNKSVKDFIDSLDNFSVSSITVGELLYGAKYSRNKEKELAHVDFIISKAQILDVDKATSDFYSDIRTELRRNGKPIPENDLWTASERYNINVLLLRLTNISEFLKV